MHWAWRKVSIHCFLHDSIMGWCDSWSTQTVLLELAGSFRYLIVLGAPRMDPHPSPVTTSSSTTGDKPPSYFLCAQLHPSICSPLNPLPIFAPTKGQSQNNKKAQTIAPKNNVINVKSMLVLCAVCLCCVVFNLSFFSVSITMTSKVTQWQFSQSQCHLHLLN